MKKKTTKKKVGAKQARKPATKKSAKRAAPAADYQATLKLNGGRPFTGEGASLIDALTAIKPGKAWGVGVLSVVNRSSRLRVEKVLPFHMLNRAFNTHGLVRQVAIKQLALRFDV